MGIFSKRGRPFRDELKFLKEIAAHLFADLLHYRPEGLSKQAYLEHLFNVKYRQIDQYEAKRQFLMPGLYLEVPNKQVKEASPRHVGSRQRLFVRHDIREPDSYQISFFSGQGRGEVVYELTAKEWRRVKPCLKKVGSLDESIT